MKQMKRIDGESVEVEQLDVLVTASVIMQAMRWQRSISRQRGAELYAGIGCCGNDDDGLYLVVTVRRLIMI